MVEALGSCSSDTNGGMPTTVQEHEIQQIELLCQQMYESTDPAERTKAERAMLEFGNSPECLNKCQLLIERATSPYSQLLGAQTLVKIVGKQNSNLTVDQRLEVRNYALNYLANRQNLAPFVVQSLTKLFAKITKLIWFDTKESQQVIPLVNQYFFQVNIERQIIGVLLLSQLVQEINQVEGDPVLHRSLTRQRRISSTFRDTYLSEIFSLSCNVLQGSLAALTSNDRSQERLKLIEVGLKLNLNCLSFDFIGTSPDESNSDDLPTVQIPSSWRRLFVENTTLDLFFKLYHNLPPHISCYALSCLVQMTSVRRSIFSNPERLNFLNRIVDGVKSILENPTGLSDPNTYHEFCRLLVRFKANFQLSELTKVPSYPDLIRLIKDFTCHAFQAWNCAPNSIHYLLMLWQKLVSSATYCKGLNGHYLDQYAPEVMQAYITYRLEGVNAVVQDGLEDPLDDTPMLTQQMEQLAHISRQSFKLTGEFLRSVFDQTAKRYEELLMTGANSVELSIIEGRLTWLIYIIGASLNGRLFVKCDDECLEGELACRVMQLIQISDSQLQLQQGRRCEKLELAFLNFYDTYRKCYVADTAQYGSKMHKKLSEVLGLTNESRLLSVFITKIILNLNCWSSSELIVKSTLSILHELSMGFASLTKIADLDEVKFMLSHHTAEHFPFLSNSGSIEFMRYRTSFYSSLGRLLIESMRCGNEEKFDEFMIPLDASFDQLRRAILVDASPAIAQNQEAKRAFIGICRDVRGLAKEFVKPQFYFLLFEWIYPTYTPLIKRALEIWYNDPYLTTPALRLIAELVDNREKRNYYDSASSESIYLFREVSSIIVSLGTRILTLTDIPEENIYQYKLKTISIMFRITQTSLRAKMNFAVFQLYGDSALNDILQMFVKLFLSIIQCDILSYPKLSLQYYPLLEVLSANHCEFLINLEPQIFGYMLTSLQAGITVSEDRISTSCFIVINNIVSQLFRWLTKVPRKIGSPTRAKEDEEKRKASMTILETHSQTFHAMMAIMLDLLMSSDQASHPQLPLPFLGLILLYGDQFQQLKNSVINSQPMERQTAVIQWFDTLMDGVSRNLSQGNRDKFIQNVLAFRRDVSEGLKINLTVTTGDNRN
uniref:Exportin-7 n=1 Tax=Aceria tosichella TaxID=561515 RepID=A0A6G1SBY7_9ACAR